MKIFSRSLKNAGQFSESCFIACFGTNCFPHIASLILMGIAAISRSLAQCTEVNDEYSKYCK